MISQPTQPSQPIQPCPPNCKGDFISGPVTPCATEKDCHHGVCINGMCRNKPN